MSGDRPVEVLVYDFLRARLAGNEAAAHLLVRALPRRELLEFTKSLAGITLESLTEILQAAGHEDPPGFIADLLDRAAAAAVDRVAFEVTYRLPLDPSAI